MTDRSASRRWAKLAEGCRERVGGPRSKLIVVAIAVLIGVSSAVLIPACTGRASYKLADQRDQQRNLFAEESSVAPLSSMSGRLDAQAEPSDPASLSKYMWRPPARAERDGRASGKDTLQTAENSSLFFIPVPMPDAGERLQLADGAAEREFRGVSPGAPAYSVPSFDEVPELAAEPILGDLFSTLGDEHRARRAPVLTLAPGEELWVIPTERVREATLEHRRSNPDEITAPACFAGFEPDAPIDQLIAMPLRHTAVNATIDGYVSAVNVEQLFVNPYDVKIEAVYVLPLPEMAAVNDFIMTIGDRRIRGVIRPREQAERIYRQARARGHIASLLTQERPNIFTQRVANIEPGKAVSVDVTYFQALPYRDGAFEFVFPMVVGPRYNPTGSPDPVNAAPLGTVVRDSDPGTTLTYLSPEERAGHNISLRVDVDARLPITSITSNTHAVDTRRTGSTSASVELSPSDRIPNRDFVLRIEIDRSEVASSLIFTPDPAASEDGVQRGTFSLMVVPPDGLHADARRPVEFIFVIDCSGSMRGPHIEIARAGARRGLRSLQAGDTFNIVRFASGADAFRPAPVQAIPENIEAGLRYLDRTEAGGGTEALSGIRAGLSPEADAERERLVVFMTDGLIGNEREVIAAIHRDLQGARIFSFGVGSSPNRFLMERMAKLGRGAVAFLGTNDSAAGVMDAFFRRISAPALADIGIVAEGMNLYAAYPSANADVLPGRPLIMTGRYAGEVPSEIEVVGTTGAQAVRHRVATQRIDASRSTGGVLATLWARTQIAHLANVSSWDNSPEIPTEIERLALTHNLVSAVTAFVAVDSKSVTVGSEGVTVHQPVNIPEGVRYETTVAPR